jgi:hypothetical protein
MLWALIRNLFIQAYQIADPEFSGIGFFVVAKKKQRKFTD